MHRLAFVVLTGCGTALWAITPRPDVTHYEVTRTIEVPVTTNPVGATLYVDGAEAGPAPKPVAIAYKELRRQRRQAIWPAIIGTAVDVALGFALTVAAADHANQWSSSNPWEQPTLPIGAALLGAGVVALDLYVINGRSIVNEGVDSQPVPVEIGARMAGYHDIARRVRIPDFTRLDLVMMPDVEAAPPPADAPKPAEPPHADAPPIATTASQ